MVWRRKRAAFVATLYAVCSLLSHAHAQQRPTEPAQKPDYAHHRNDTGGNTEILKQVLMKKCLHHYTMTCVKLDLVRLIDRLGTARAYQLVQGISLVRAVAASPSDGNQTTANGHHDHSQHHQNHGIPPEVVRSLVRGNESNDDLDGYLMEKVDAYLGSLSISVKLVDSSVVDHIRKLSSQMLANVLPTDLLETGRGKKNGMHAALWSAGTLAAIGFASLAAMSGKALMTAMLALVLAAICALKGHGGGGGGGGGGYGKTSHYEIITKPAIYDHEHLVHGATYSSAPYSYARHLTMDEGGGSGGGGGGGGGGAPYGGPPQRVSAMRVAPPLPSSSGGGGGVDDDDPSGQQQPSYPLSPITYIPTNNT